MFQGSYAWANFTILALGVWAVAQRDSVDAISMVSGGSSTGNWLQGDPGPPPCASLAHPHLVSLEPPCSIF